MSYKPCTIDYQVHSFRSHDGLATIREQCLRAVELGLDEIGFTEHKDFDPLDPVVIHFDYDLYGKEIEAARSEFDGQLIIRKGIEIDYQRWFEDEIGLYLRQHQFDFVMGCVHHIDRVMVMSSEYLSTRDRDTSYRDYFRAVTDSAKTGLFDIIGHLEYANRRGVPAFGPYDANRYRDELTDLFGIMLEKNALLEINSAGIRYHSGGTYPSLRTVELYVEFGGNTVTFGSDAHEPAYLAADFDRAREVARSAGIKQLATFSDRTPAFNPI
ncbi:MAG: histidinol-phosphatase HisJ family protein [Chthonomonadales bacterium]